MFANFLLPCRSVLLFFVLIFWKQYHNESVLKKYGSKLKVGTVKEEAKL